jgi:type IX secretion system PorP/SprF family membrane protein
MNKYILILIFALGVTTVNAQDPQFSQFYASPLYLGPSMAGTGGSDTRFILNYRDQWPKLAGKFITYALSFDHFIPKYKSGIGLLALYDDAGNGKLTTTQIGANYSYRITLSRDFFIQPGIQFQYFQRRINFYDLTFASQYFGDQLLPTNETPPDNQNGHIDFSSSLLAFGKKFWIGFTFDHMMKLNSSLENDDRYVPIKTSLYGGYKFIISERLLRNLEQSMTIAFHYKQQSYMQQLDMGLYYHQFPFSVGIWYRGIPIIQSTKSHDAITASAGIEVKEFTITYSYDLTVSTLVTSTGGAHEIGILYSFEWGKRGRQRRMATVPCPRF